MIIASIKNQKLLSLKLSILGFSQLILLILIVVFAIKTKNTFNEYGWGINFVDDNLSLSAQNTRIFLLLFISLFNMISLFNFYYNKQFSFNKKWIKYLFLFNYILLPLFIRHIVKYKDLKLFKNYQNLSLSKYEGIINFKNNNKQVKINLFVYFITFIVFLTSFILIFIKQNNDTTKVSSLFIISKLSYFTNLSNIACFFYLFLLLFFHNKRTMNNSGLIIALTTYITIVGLIYWCMLFPTSVVVDPDKGAMKLIRGIWLHTTAPISFILFFIFSLKTNNLVKNQFKKILPYGLIYPLWYGSYIYTIPFMVKESIYGVSTNLNPHMILQGDTQPTGSPWYTFCILAFGLAFSLFFAIFYWINKKINHSALI